MRVKQVNKQINITRQLTSDIEGMRSTIRVSSKYEGIGNDMQKMDGGQTRKVESMAADDSGCPRVLQKSSSGTFRFLAASGRNIQKS